MATQRQGLRHDTDANWTSADSTLLTDETVVVDDQRKLIRGDGSTYNTSFTTIGYLSDQSILTTDAVQFATVNTGQGDNELYAMDQDVQTTDSPQFAGVVYPITSVTSSTYTAGTSDVVIEADTSSNSITITLPDRATYQGRTLVIRKVASANTVTIQRAGTDTITRAGLTSVTLTSDGDYWSLFAGSTRWELVDGIESGSNANGGFVKYSNGIIYQYSDSLAVESDNVLGSGVAVSTSPTTWTYPVSGITEPAPYPSNASSNANEFVFIIGVTANDANINICNLAGIVVSRTNVKVALYGRWYA